MGRNNSNDKKNIPKTPPLKKEVSNAFAKFVRNVQKSEEKDKLFGIKSDIKDVPDPELEEFDYSDSDESLI